MHDAFAFAAMNRRTTACECVPAITTTRTTGTGTRWRMRLGVVD